MTTWYTNTLLIVGPEDDIQAFRAAVRPTGRTRPADRTALSLRSLVPVAPSYKRQLELWGTPWDIRAKMTEDSTTGIEYTFKSAVAPPLPWLKSASRKFPSLKFCPSYESKQARIYGSALFEGGAGEDVRTTRIGRFFWQTKVETLKL
jgi:hypothetical protein